MSRSHKLASCERRRFSSVWATVVVYFPLLLVGVQVLLYGTAAAQPAEPLSCGVPLTRRIEIGAIHGYVIAGPPGDRVHIDVADVSGSIGLIEIDPRDGSRTCQGWITATIPESGQLAIDVADCNRDDAGEYTIVVQGVSPGSGNCAPQSACGLVPSALQTAGEVDAFTISGVAGSQLTLTTPGRSANTRLRLRLFDPAGQEINGGNPNCSGSLRVNLAQTGEHTLLVSSCQQPPTTGGYTLTGAGGACPAGPVITHFGLARSDDLTIEPDGFDDANRPIYTRPFGLGFSLVLEAHAGSNGQPPGLDGFVDDPNDPAALPDAQLATSRPLGYATATVCDDLGQPGGVPAVAALDFAATPFVANAVNDLGCRINDGLGRSVGRVQSDEACTRLPVTLDFSFVDPTSTVQFCAPIASAWSFGFGSTIVKARVRATDGSLGAPREIVVRVEAESPFLLNRIDPQEAVGVGPVLFFSAESRERGLELWRSDGTRKGTALYRDLIEGSRGSSPRGLVNVNDLLFFVADTATSASWLWRAFADSTFVAPVTATDIGSALPGPWALTNVAGRLFYFVEDGPRDLALWRSDGTETGTQPVWPFDPPVGMVDFPTAVGGTFFFTSYDADSDPDAFTLWRSDGTQEGSAFVQRLEFPGSSRVRFGELTDVDGTLFFVAGGGGDSGFGLWRSDGTAAGTVRLKNFVPGSSGLAPAELTALDGTLFFAADDGVRGAELWKSDGTGNGTVLVADINPGPASSMPHALTRANSRLFFAAADGITGVEFWRSNGTRDGTIRVKDINPGPDGSDPSGLADINGTIQFAADDGVHGSEPWVSDGTADGTLMVLDLAANDASSRPDLYTAVAPSGTRSGTVFFRTQHATPDASLWAVPYPAVRPPIPTCTGDCNANLVVAVNELVTGVGIALGTVDIERCDAFDTRRDNLVTIEELVGGVRSALDGCL